MEVAQLKMDKKYLEDKHQMEIEKVRSEYEDKLGSDKKIEGIVGTILPHLGLGGDDGMGMAGIGMNGVMTENSPKQIILNSVNKLVKLDPDFPKNIERLASLAESKPTIYQMAVKQLNDLG